MGFSDMAVKRIEMQLADITLSPEKRQELENQKKQLLLEQQNAEIQRVLLGGPKTEKPKYI